MALRFEALFVVGVILTVAVWQLISLKRHSRKRRELLEEERRRAKRDEPEEKTLIS